MFRVNLLGGKFSSGRGEKGGGVFGGREAMSLQKAAIPTLTSKTKCGTSPNSGEGGEKGKGGRRRASGEGGDGPPVST